MAIKYYVANNTGKGFITHLENAASHISGHPGNVYTTENEAWATRVGAVEKTKEEAQVICDNAECKDADGNQLYLMSGSYDESGNYSEVEFTDTDGNKIPVTYTLP